MNSTKDYACRNRQQFNIEIKAALHCLSKYLRIFSRCPTHNLYRHRHHHRRCDTLPHLLQVLGVVQTPCSRPPMRSCAGSTLFVFSYIKVAIHADAK